MYDEGYVRQYQRKKSQAFGEALDEFLHYRNTCLRYVEQGKMTKEEADAAISERADALDL